MNFYLNEWAAWLARPVVDVGRHGAGQEGGAQVEGDAGKPDDGDAEAHTLRRVPGGGVPRLGGGQHRGQQAEGGGRDQQQEGGLQQGAAGQRRAVKH